MKTVILGMAKACRDFKGAKEPKIRLDLLQLIHYANRLVSQKLCDSVVCFMVLPLETSQEKNKEGTIKRIYDNKKFIEEWKNKYLFLNEYNIEFHMLFIENLLEKNEKRQLMRALENSRNGNQNKANAEKKSKANFLKAAEIIEKKMEEQIKEKYRGVKEIDDMAIKEVLSTVKWDYKGMIEIS